MHFQGGECLRTFRGHNQVNKQTNKQTLLRHLIHIPTTTRKERITATTGTAMISSLSLLCGTATKSKVNYRATKPESMSKITPPQASYFEL